MVDTQETGDYSPRTPRAITVAWSAMQRYRIPSAVLVGLSLPLARLAFDGLFISVSGMTRSVAMTVSVVQCSLNMLALAAICWPWVSYSVAFRLSLAGAITFVCAGSVNVIARHYGEFDLVPWLFPLGVSLWFALFSAIALAFLFGFVFVRRRYWPVYPPGHCKRCGYNLTGNVSGNCSECGTPLVSEKTTEEGASPQQPSCDEGTISNPND